MTMNKAFESFNPEALFSTDNPVFNSAMKAHKLVAEAFDRTARLQLGLAEDLLNLNRKRIDSIHAGGSLQDTLSAQQDILTETGSRLGVYAEGIKDVADSFQTDLGRSANEWAEAATDIGGTAGKGTRKTRAKAA
jgi:hypothetical protein